MIVTSLVCYIIVFFLYKYRIGFSFISMNDRLNKPLSKTIYPALIMGIVSIASTSALLFLWDRIAMLGYGITFFLLAVIFHLSYKKEISE